MSGSDVDVKPSKSFAADTEVEAYQKIEELLAQCPIPRREILANLALFMNRRALGDLLFMHDLYQRIVDVQGVIMEFGVRWGRNMALMTTCRTLFEPHNYTRRLIGFDTFAGFPSVAPEDGSGETVAPGVLSVVPGYENYLAELLEIHEQLAPRPHIRKFELVKGDVMETLPRYLEEHPETVIAMAYFDMDLYEPTKRCLELIEGHLTKGSVVGFDEVGSVEYPGETQALREAWGTSRYSLRRSPNVPHQSYLVVE